MNKVIVIAGPTASGKTGLGIEVAGAIGGEIISADSMQVYKNMPIATAAPTDDEKSQAPHHLVEFLDNDKKFSVAQWCTLAKEKIDDIISRGKVPIVVGGTGLFIDSLVDNISFEDVEVDEDLRQSLMKRDVDSLYDELLRVDKKLSMTGQDVGFVGDIKKVNAEVLLDLLDKDFLPIVCPVGIDDDYNTYNINADDAAYSIAKAVHAEKLAFLSDIEGVYRDYEDKSSLITALTVDQANELIESGAISGGMIPKLQNCVGAIENGVSRVHILDGRIPHCLLLEIFTKKGIGTAILRNGEED